MAGTLLPFLAEVYEKQAINVGGMALQMIFTLLNRSFKKK